MYERPCRRRNRDRTPRTGTGPAWAHMTSGDQATVRKPSKPATARRAARTLPQKHTRILCLPTAICAIYAQRSRGGRAARPSATTPVRQPMLADRRSRRPPELAAAAAPALHVVLQCSRSQLPRSGHDDRRRAPARILKQGTGTIRGRQGGCLQGAHTRVWGHRESAPAVAPAATCSLTAAQAAALRPNSVASRSPLQLQRPSPDTIPESIEK